MRLPSLAGSRHSSLLLLLPLLTMLPACQPARGPTPAVVAQQFYDAVIAIRATGAPDSATLARLAPFLSDSLRSLLTEARRVHDAESVRAPDEKPAFADGDLYSSLFEGPTSAAVAGELSAALGVRVAMQLTDNRASPPVSWTDTLMIGKEYDHYVIHDIIYGGDWAFANRGSLRQWLTEALHDAPPTAS
jgi:hypothetical protein